VSQYNRAVWWRNIWCRTMLIPLPAPERSLEDDISAILEQFSKTRKKELAQRLRSSLETHGIQLLPYEKEGWPEPGKLLLKNPIDFVRCCGDALGRDLTDREKGRLRVLSKVSGESGSTDKISS